MKLESVSYIRKDLHQINSKFLDVHAKFRTSLEQILFKDHADFQRELSDLAQIMDDELKKSDNPK